MDTICIFQEKRSENGVCALIYPILHTFDTAYAEN